MRKLHIIVGATALSLSAIAHAQSQKTFTPQGVSTDWFAGSNWTGGTIPSLNDDVLIPDGTLCIIADNASIGMSKSVEVEDGGELRVIEGQTLHIRTPDDNTYPPIKVDGTVAG